MIVLGCRLPGDVRSASGLWDFLCAKKSGQGAVPPTRWNIDSFYHPNGNEKAGSMNMRGGYFINEDLRNFENSFFGINNLEATFMDPQQRKLLEVVYECFESAGLTLEDVSDANIGTYVGSFTTVRIICGHDPLPISMLDGCEAVSIQHCALKLD